MMQFDTLIIGSGLAGLSLALKLADRQKVAIITKKSLLEGASARAQGGIAAVLSQADSLAEHIRIPKKYDALFRNGRIFIIPQAKRVDP